MFYVIIWDGLPLHTRFGDTAKRYENHSRRGSEWHALTYEPGPVDATVKVTAGTVADARVPVGQFYGLDDRHNAYRPTRWVAEHPDAPPPPDWPADEPAACPECKNTGRVLLFSGYSPCSLCAPKRAE